MKFNPGDKVDSDLCTVISHEMLLCKDYFDSFSRLAAVNIMGLKDTGTKLKIYHYYSTFLHHLYEFYVACIKRELRKTDKLDYKFLDKFFNKEAEKLLKNRIDAISGEYAPSWENHISAYQIEVPDDFGKQFRKMRNRTAHALIKRSFPEDEPPMIEFYTKYHKFIYLLYSSGLWWLTKDIDSVNWKEIGSFDLSIH